MRKIKQNLFLIVPAFFLISFLGLIFLKESGHTTFFNTEADDVDFPNIEIRWKRVNIPEYGNNTIADQQAAFLYQDAAEHGNAKAQFILGRMYAEGIYFKQSHEETFKWYSKAAEQGELKAINNLGAMHEKGIGVPEDYSEAVKWYSKAAEQGDVYAQYNLAEMYSGGRGIPQDYVEAAKWYRRAAEEGFVAAQISLAYLYYKGEGVRKDFIESYALINNDLARISKESNSLRGVLENLMSPSEILQAKARANEWAIRRERAKKGIH